MGKCDHRNNVFCRCTEQFQMTHEVLQNTKKQKSRYAYACRVQGVSSSENKIHHIKSFPSKMVVSAAVRRKVLLDLSHCNQLKLENRTGRHLLKRDMCKMSNMCKYITVSNKSHDFYCSNNFTPTHPLKQEQNVQQNFDNIVIHNKDNFSVCNSSLNTSTNKDFDFNCQHLRESPGKTWSNNTFSTDKKIPEFMFSFQQSNNNINYVNEINDDLHNLCDFNSNDAVTNKKMFLRKTSIAVKQEYSELLENVTSKNNKNNFFKSDDFLRTKRSEFSFTQCRKHAVASSSVGSVLSDTDVDRNIYAESTNNKEFILNICKDLYCNDIQMKMSALELLSNQKCTSLPDVSTLTSDVAGVSCFGDNTCLCKVCASRASCDLEGDDGLCEITSLDEDSCNESSIDVSNSAEDDGVDSAVVDLTNVLPNSSFSDISDVSLDESDADCEGNSDCSYSVEENFRDKKKEKKSNKLIQIHNEE